MTPVDRQQAAAWTDMDPHPHFHNNRLLLVLAAAWVVGLPLTITIQPPLLLALQCTPTGSSFLSVCLFLLQGLFSVSFSSNITHDSLLPSSPMQGQRQGRSGGGGGCDEEQEDGVVAVAAGKQARMEIGWPTDVRHVAHVTFDRFHGFRGVPEELQQLQPGVVVVGAPSASKTVFGVSTESMQCAYDAQGNSVPTVLLHLQRRLYDQGGLRAEGIFRLAADGAQEQYARDHLDNAGVVPDGVDVHCIAGLIKAWFRELPGGGLLDSLPAEEVTRCQTEDDCARLCGARLPAPRAALLDWAVNLMADVAREEKANRMGTRNVAMVFAPNMTRADDPLTALGHAVHLMNFLNMLVERALKQPTPPTTSSSPSSSS